MSVSENEEHGAKLFARHNGDAIASIPIKKRPFPLVWSPTPPPSHIPSLPANHCDMPLNEPSFSEPESSISDVCGQMPGSGPSVFRSASGEYREELLDDKDVNITLNYASSPGFSQGLMFTLGANASIEISNGGKLTPDNTSAFGPVVEKTEVLLASREPELSLGEGSGGRKLVMSDKSAFNRVLGNSEFSLALKKPSELSTRSQNLVGSFAKQEKMDLCSLDLGLGEGQYNVQSKHNDTESSYGSGNLHANRSHWDLNTMMDSWGGSSSEAPLSHGAGGDDGFDVGDINRKKVETHPVQLIHQESSGTHVMSGKCDVYGSDCSFKLFDLPTFCSKHYGTDTDLNLHLNTALGSMSHLNSGMTSASVLSSHKNVSDLSLSVEPMSPTHSPKSAVAIAVKREPTDEGSVKESNLELVSHTIEKSEPLERGLQEGNNVKMACSAVKSEPLEVSSQAALRTVDGEASHTEFHTCVLEAPISKMLQDTTGNVTGALDLVPQALIADGNKIHHFSETPIVEDVPQVTSKSIINTSDLVAEPLVSDDTKSDFGQEMPINADIPQVASEIIDNFPNVVLESVVPDVDNFQNGQVMPIGADIPQDADQKVGRASELVSESMTRMDNEFNSIKVASEVIDGASGLLLDAVFSDSKEQTVGGGMPEICVQMSYLYGGTLKPSRLFSADECSLGSYGDREIAETDEKGKVHKSESSEHEFGSDGSRAAVGLTGTVPKQHGDDDDFEDGEVQDLLLHGAIEGSCEENKVKHVHVKEAADSVPVNIPITMPEHVDGNESNTQKSDDSKDVHCAVESESLLCNVKNDAGLNTAVDVKESSAIGMPAAGTGKKRPVKIIRKISQDQLVKKKSLETKPTSNKTLSASCAKGIDDSQVDVGGKQVKARGNNILPADHSILSKAEASVSCDATKYVRSRGDQSRTIHLNSSSNVPSFGRTKYVHGRSFSSRIEKEKLKDESLRGEKAHLRGIRYERHFDGLNKSEKGRSQDQQLRKPESDFSRIRGWVDPQLDTLHANWDPHNGYVSDHFNRSTSFHLPRPKNASESAFTVGMDGLFRSAGRTVRKHVEDELKNSCRLPSRRHSPGGREGPVPVGVKMVRRTMRDISPGRYIEGGFPELHTLSCEEKLRRDFADDMIDPSLFSRPKYEPAENCLIRRKRRSLSPFQRRGAPHLSHSCSTSSPRLQTRSPRLWSASRRTPVGFDGHPELIHCRSPPDHRVERMRSPRQHACFTDDMMAKRHASPPYIPRVSDEMRDTDPLREHDLLRHGRHLQRNIRGCDLIETQVHAEEDHFGRLHFAQFHGLEGDDKYVDERRDSDLRRGLVRSFRQPYNVGNGDDNDEPFHYRVEDVPPRPIRFFPELSEEFPDRGISRDDCIRNRLGNMHRRLRGMEEQEDNYRHVGGRGWHDGSFKDAQLKRRRF